MTRRVTAAHRFTAARLAAVVAIGLFVLTIGLVDWPRASADQLQLRSIQISNSAPASVATYTVSFVLLSPETLGSIELQFCGNSPLFSDACTAPTGFDDTTATLSAQTGATGFTISPASTTNVLILTRTPGSASAALSYTFTGMTNPSDAATFFARLQTFSSNDATGSPNDLGGIAMSTSQQVQITTTVPPYLLFCLGITITGNDCGTASGSYINFGNFASSATSSATTQMAVVTNAANGYAITVDGSTMTSGTNTIPALTTADVSRPGVGQFGLNLVANTTPNVGANVQGPGAATVASGYDQTDFFRFVSGEPVAGASSADDFRKFTTSYVVNIPQGQPIGVYVSTLTYTCLANF